MTAPEHWQIRHLRLVVAALFVVLLGACSTVVRAPARKGANTSHAGSVADGGGVSATSPDEARAGYARVLQRHVNDQGEVDFAALLNDVTDTGIGALESYVRAIAVTPLDAGLTRQARLAHMINGYNALSTYNVIASNIPLSHHGFAKVQFFVLRKFVIGNTTMSLYDFENGIIRKLGEPRVHFALNCSAVSCPALPRTVFTAGPFK